MTSIAKRARVTNVLLFIGFLYFFLPVLPALADDALVLPRHAWRFYLVPTWSTVQANFDANGNRQAIAAGSGRIHSFNLGYAIEYGVNKWLSAGCQWSPGTTLSSSLDYPAGDALGRDKAELTDAFDALAGFKFQLVGSRARDPRRATGLFQSAKMRLAFAGAVKFPLTAIDWNRESENFAQGNRYLVQAADKHLVAPIVSIHFDFVFIKDAKKEFFINLYSQFIPYLSEGNYNRTSLARYLNPSLAAVGIDYGYDFLVEVDPHFERWLVPRLLRAGLYLPVRCKIFPATRLDGVGQGNGGCRWTISPTLDLFTAKGKFPVELRVAYQYAFAGKNTTQANTLLIVLRVIVL